MIAKLLKAVDSAAHRALLECAQPMVAGGDQSVAYCAGLRIGKNAGIQFARQAILDAIDKDESKDNDL